MTIKEALERAADDSSTKEEIERAYSLAMKYQFLTPFTDMTFNGDPNANQTAVQISTLQKLVNYLLMPKELDEISVTTVAFFLQDALPEDSADIWRAKPYILCR